ncbi:MAG: hypothetical protein HRF49_11905 [bacterium]
MLNRIAFRGIAILALALAALAAPALAATEARVSEFQLYTLDDKGGKHPTSVFNDFHDVRYDIVVENNKTHEISGGLCFVWMWYGEPMYGGFCESVYKIAPGKTAEFRGFPIARPEPMPKELVDAKGLNIARVWAGRTPDHASKNWVLYVFADDNGDGDFSDAIAIYNATFDAGGYAFAG